MRHVATGIKTAPSHTCQWHRATCSWVRVVESTSDLRAGQLSEKSDFQRANRTEGVVEVRERAEFGLS